MTSTGIKIASIANGAIAAATFAAGALDAVWSVASRTLTAISDSAGVTTLLGRVIGTLAAGTHNPQSGDSYARLGSPAGANISADIATISAKTINLPASPAEVGSAMTLTSAYDAAAIAASQTSVDALAARLAEQVAEGPVVVVPAPNPGQTTAWVMCYTPAGLPEAAVTITITCTKAAAPGAFDSTPVVLVSGEDGLASGPIPRGVGLTFTAKRGTSGKPIKFYGVDADTLALPALVGAP